MNMPGNNNESSLNWLGGILIIVSWHIHFNKVSMPLTPVCCFANYLQGLQFPSSLIILESRNVNKNYVGYEILGFKHLTSKQRS